MLSDACASDSDPVRERLKTPLRSSHPCVVEKRPVLSYLRFIVPALPGDRRVFRDCRIRRQIIPRSTTWYII